ncbi:hypothetical protein H257_08707 [Aphanomyces astaci]|uniref:Photolyase/cryptochrome alpha/beta domain-containing protein n=1 Tax=Aphanomyces astaci TaxID=112090 RepID=W4GC58_APHAT|nr:hypothetical protein H257_08707 [Aphanomyces astaci]ETV77250.1 hypothetical protein H257_08707 [Aphanomyces astaci]|eukprot:XP_009833037.1 hypothetical protein H257_08707 [Aphanomyces astaci]
MWAAIESYEDRQTPTNPMVLPSSTQIVESQSALLCDDICPESSDEPSDDEDSPGNVDDSSISGHLLLSSSNPQSAPLSPHLSASVSPIKAASLERTVRQERVHGVVGTTPCATETEDTPDVELTTPPATHNPEPCPSTTPPRPSTTSPRLSNTTVASIHEEESRPVVAKEPLDLSLLPVSLSTDDDARGGAVIMQDPHVDSKRNSLRMQECEANLVVVQSPPRQSTLMDQTQTLAAADHTPIVTQPDSNQVVLAQNQTSPPTPLLPPIRPQAASMIPIDLGGPAQTDDSSSTVLIPPTSTLSHIHHPPIRSQELDAVQVLASLTSDCPSLASWLRLEGDVDTTMFDDNSYYHSPPPSPVSHAEPSCHPPIPPAPPCPSVIPSLIDAWPRSLRRRCHVIHPTASSSQPLPPSVKPESIVLWIQETWRVHHNYALAAADWLHATHDLPLVAFCVLPSSMFYPEASPMTTNDNGMRASVAYMRRQLQARGIPLHGIILTHDKDGDDVSSALLSLRPWAVVTDDVVDAYGVPPVLELPTTTLFLMDSTCCVPWRTFVGNAVTYSKHEFERVWLAAWDAVDDDDNRIPSPHRRDGAFPASCCSSNHLPWSNLDKPSAFDLSERTALSHMHTTCVQVGTTKPALQEELHGRGVTSCLPFLRHGSLSAMYLLTTLKATSNQVLYSRALTHCVLAREYAKYVLLRQVDARHDGSTLAASNPPFHAAASRPLWVYRSLVAQAVTPRSTPLQDPAPALHSEKEDQVVVYQLPYQLEASRSPDRTWNDIMTHVRLTGYVHPVLASYWGRQLLGPWSPSPVAGLGMLEGLVMRYSIGATADVVVQVLLSMIHDDATADLLAAQTDDHPLLVQLRAAVTDAPLSHD